MRGVDGHVKSCTGMEGVCQWKSSEVQWEGCVTQHCYSDSESDQ